MYYTSSEITIQLDAAASDLHQVKLKVYQQTGFIITYFYY